MISKAYFVRQAAILFGLAKATTDPRISAALLDKAAELQGNKPDATADLTFLAPDVEPPSATLHDERPLSIQGAREPTEAKRVDSVPSDKPV